MKTLIALVFVLIASGCTRPVKPTEKDVLLGECLCKELGGLKEISKTVYHQSGGDYSMTIYCSSQKIDYYKNNYYAGCGE